MGGERWHEAFRLECAEVDLESLRKHDLFGHAVVNILDGFFDEPAVGLARMRGSHCARGNRRGLSGLKKREDLLG